MRGITRTILPTILPAALFAIAAQPLLAPQALAEERSQFNAADGVPAAQIREQGYVLTLSNGTEVKLTDVVVREQRPDCMVHIPSLTRRIENGLRNNILAPIGTAAQSVSLQVNQDPTTGELWCGGAGSGCTIVIQ